MAVDKSIRALVGHLHDQLAAVLDPDITPEQLDLEVKRSNTVTSISRQITDSERVLNERAKIMTELAPDAAKEILSTKGVTYDSN